MHSGGQRHFKFESVLASIGILSECAVLGLALVVTAKSINYRKPSSYLQRDDHYSTSANLEARDITA